MDNIFNHFKLLHSAPDVDSFSYTQKHIIDELRKRLPQAMQFNALDQPFTEDEFRASFKSLKNKKSPGLDRIRSELLKCGVDYLSQYLSNKIIQFNTQ